MDESEIRFDRFVLDTLRHRLLANGKPVKLDAKACLLLEVLLQSRDRPVGRDELLSAVWPGVTVAPGSVAVQVSAIRRALQLAGCKEELILTVKQPLGYRFVGTVLTEPEKVFQPRLAPEPALLAAALAPPVPRRIGWVPAAFVAVPLVVTGAMLAPSWIRRPAAPSLSIAVLPFEAAGHDPAATVLANAITDDLATDLGHIPDSHITARESAEAYRNRGATVEQIGRALNVHYVISGQVLAEGPNYRVTMHLDDASTGAQIWGASRNFRASEIGTVSQTIEGSLANAMKFQIDQLESTRSLHDRPDDPDALGLFFRARALIDVDESKKAYYEAVGLLRQAVAKRPDFSDALAELGYLILHGAQSREADFREADVQEAHLAIQRANELSPHNTTALAAKALALEIDGKCVEAEHVAREALDVQASNVQALSVLTSCAWLFGHLEEAQASLVGLGQINPDGHGRIRSQLMQAHIDILTGHPHDALALLRGAVADLPEPSATAHPFSGQEYVRILLMAAYVMSGDMASARSLCAEYMKYYHNRSVWRIAENSVKAISSLERSSGFYTALNAAGLPYYTDEEATAGGPCEMNADEFSSTPTQLAGGETIGTARMFEMAKSAAKVLVIDTGRGVASFPGAKWKDHSYDPTGIAEYVNHIMSERNAGEVGLPVVVMGAGPFDCATFLAAELLVAKGQEKILWYRGGEEAWSHSGGHAEDRRPY